MNIGVNATPHTKTNKVQVPNSNGLLDHLVFPCAVQVTDFVTHCCRRLMA
jgi:hypothetical protein